MPTAPPDLSSRPFSLTVDRVMSTPPDTLYLAWTQKFDRWFAAPGTALMHAAVDSVFYFETQFERARHPHYGRFLRLEPNRLIEITWVTAGTLGAETVVTVELTPDKGGALLRLTHAGFPDEPSRDRHRDAWPMVLAHQDQRFQQS